jgi:hypothetical protein
VAADPQAPQSALVFADRLGGIVDVERHQAVAITEGGLTLCWTIPGRRQIGVLRLFNQGHYALYKGIERDRR